MKFLHPFFGLFLLCLLSGACRKDNSSFITKDPSIDNCNNTIMNLKRVQSTLDDRFYLKAEWNTNGTIKMLEINTILSYGMNATYIYENGRIKEAVLRDIDDNEIYDTAVFVYNAQGKVDSMYLKDNLDDYNNNMKLTYTNGKLTKLAGYTGKELKYYFDITTDANQNITKAVEYHITQRGLSKENTFTFTRDTKKNPLKDLAVYMLYLDDPYAIFWHWGANNYTNQRYEAHTDPIIDITSGEKYKYNDNCYPKASTSTVFGTVISDEDDWLYTYY